MRTFLAAATALALAPATAEAQHLVAYDPIPGTGMMFEEQLPSALLPGPVPPTAMYPAIPPLAGPPALVPPGDATFDSVTGLIWFTEGVTLASMPSPSFAPVPALPPFPIGPAALAALGGGPVTGIAIDPVAGIMWMTSAPGGVIGVAPLPGTPIVFPLFFVPFPAGPITGLEWDALTGTLFACDVVGVVYPFLPGGVPAGPVIAGAVPAPAGDVAIDKTGALNGAGVRPIYVCGPGITIDITFAAAPPLPLPAALPAGLAYLPLPASNMPGGSCPCGGLAPAFGVNSPMATGNPAFGITVAGLPPGTPVIMAYDGVFAPGFPLINLTGCGLGIIPGSATVVTFFTLTGPGGVAVWPLPLTFIPPTIGPVFAQALFPCTVDPLGFTLTPMQQIWVSGF